MAIERKYLKRLPLGLKAKYLWHQNAKGLDEFYITFARKGPLHAANFSIRYENTRSKLTIPKSMPMKIGAEKLHLIGTKYKWTIKRG